MNGARLLPAEMVKQADLMRHASGCRCVGIVVLMRDASTHHRATIAGVMRDASPESDRVQVGLMSRALGNFRRSISRGDASRITLRIDQSAVPPRAPALPHRFVFVTNN